MVFGAIKRHTVKIRYKLLPPPVTSWHRQSHQLRQQRLPRRHIQTGGASAGYAHMADDEIIAGRVAAPSPRRRPTSRIQGRHIQTGGASTGYAHMAGDKIVAGRAAESPSWRPASCVQERSERFSGTIKRHTVKFRYNLLPLPYTSWI